MDGVLQMAQNERNASMNNRMKLINKGITKDHRKWKWKWMSFIYKSLAMELTVEVMLLNRIGSAGSTKKALISLASKLLSHVLRKIRSDRHWQDAPSIKAIRGERLMITWTRLVTSSPFLAPESYTQTDVRGMWDKVSRSAAKVREKTYSEDSSPVTK